MDFYDLAADGLSVDKELTKKLGFKRIFTLNRDINAAGMGSKEIQESIAFGKDINQLIGLVKNGAKAVSITDSYIDKKLMETIAQNDCILCIPMTGITASYGVERTKNIYRISKLFHYANKNKIRVAFVSMAKSNMFLNSYIQLIELAKLIGSDERYARHSLSEINKLLVSK